MSSSGQHRLQKALTKVKDQAEAAKQALREGLPHLFGYKWYGWAKAFFESRNRMSLLCAANQISKSSTQIRKAIHWATCTKIWPELWSSTPRQFWYLYPSKEVATAEWHTKWLPEFMPADKYKDHPIYGWEVQFDKKFIHSIRFNSGVTIYFKTYAQDVHTLQSGTVHAIFCDEELPEELYSELKARLFATDGYFSMVFTATRNQVMWLRAIEGTGEEELFKDAFKLQVSMYDCQTYTDGTPGAYDAEKIKRVIADCKNSTEVQRRVFGKFVNETGRCIGEFDPLRHFKKQVAISRDWHYYSGLDYGSGGTAHPGAWAIIAVRPDYRLGYVIRGWKGDDGVDTTAGDILDNYIIGRAELKPVAEAYDHAAKDLGTIADRMGETLIKAEKSQDIGEGILNTLFKNDMLLVFDTEQLRKAGTEFMTVMKETAKRHRKDDLSDAIRFAAAQVPWDWSALKGEPTEEELQARQVKQWTDADRVAWEIQQRRGEFDKNPEEGGLQDELDFWNDQYGT